MSLAERAVINNANVLPHSNQDATPQIIFTTKASLQHGDPQDDRHAYDSMRRFAELLTLKCQKMKEIEPYPQFPAFLKWINDNF